MASKIKDGMFIGDQYVASDVDFIIANKVTHVINCAANEVQDFWSRIGIKYFDIDWPQDPQSNTYANVYDDKNDMLHRLAEFVTSAQNQGESILIHSVTGRNRAPAAVVALFMYMYGWGLHKVMDFLSSKRNSLRPCAPLLHQLVALDQKFSKFPPGAYINGHLSSEELKRRRHSWELAHPNSNAVVTVAQQGDTEDGMHGGTTIVARSTKNSSGGGQILISSRIGDALGNNVGLRGRPGTPAAGALATSSSVSTAPSLMSSATFHSSQSSKTAPTKAEPSASFKRTQHDEVILHHTFVNSISVSDSFPYTSASMNGRTAIPSPKRQPTIRWVDSPTRIKEANDEGEDVMRSPFSKQPLPTRPPGPSYRSLKAGRGWVDEDAEDTKQRSDDDTMTSITLPVSVISCGPPSSSSSISRAMSNVSMSPRSPVPGQDCELRSILMVRNDDGGKSSSWHREEAEKNDKAGKSKGYQVPSKLINAPTTATRASKKNKKNGKTNAKDSWSNGFEQQQNHRDELHAADGDVDAKATPIQNQNPDVAINSNNYDAESISMGNGAGNANQGSLRSENNRLFTMSTIPSPGKEPGLHAPRAAGSAAAAVMLLSNKEVARDAFEDDESRAAVTDNAETTTIFTEEPDYSHQHPSQNGGKSWVRSKFEPPSSRSKNGLRRGGGSECRLDRRHLRRHQPLRGKSNHLRSLSNGSRTSGRKQLRKNNGNNNNQRHHHSTLSFQNSKKQHHPHHHQLSTGDGKLRRQSSSSALLSDPRSSSSKLSALNSSSSAPLLTTFHDTLGQTRLKSIDRNGVLGSNSQQHRRNQFSNNLVSGGANSVLGGGQRISTSFEQRVSDMPWSEIKHKAKLSMRPASAFIEDDTSSSKTLLVKSRRRPASSDHRLRAAHNSNTMEEFMMGVGGGGGNAGSSRPRWR